jgi:hypothetical protein
MSTVLEVPKKRIVAKVLIEFAVFIISARG